MGNECRRRTSKGKGVLRFIPVMLFPLIMLTSGLNVDKWQRHLKIWIAANVSPASICQICKSEKCSRTIINTLQESVKKCFKSGKHTNKNTDEDLKTIVEELVENHVFEKQNDRTYQFYQFWQEPTIGPWYVNGLQVDKWTQRKY